VLECKITQQRCEAEELQKRVSVGVSDVRLQSGVRCLVVVSGTKLVQV
jgi:hypothetical protein